jgi:hypothetical protein
MQRNTIQGRVGLWGLMLALGASLLGASAPRASAQNTALQSLDPAAIQAAAEVDYWTAVVKFYTQLKAGLKGEIYRATLARKQKWPVLYAAYPTRPAIYAKTRFLDFPFSAVSLQDLDSFVFNTAYAKDVVLKEGGEKLPHLRKVNAYISLLKQEVSTLTLTTLPAAEIELENAKENLDQILSPLTEPAIQPAAAP